MSREIISSSRPVPPADWQDLPVLGGRPNPLHQQIGCLAILIAVFAFWGLIAWWHLG